MSNPKVEYLETLHKQLAATKQIVDGVRKVQDGGVDGIVGVALVQPQAILTAIDALCMLIQVQQTTILELAEDKFKLLDQLDNIADHLYKD